MVKSATCTKTKTYSFGLFTPNGKANVTLQVMCAKFVVWFTDKSIIKTRCRTDSPEIGKVLPVLPNK